MYPIANIPETATSATMTPTRRYRPRGRPPSYSSAASSASDKLNDLRHQLFPRCSGEVYKVLNKTPYAYGLLGPAIQLGVPPGDALGMLAAVTCAEMAFFRVIVAEQ